MKGFFSKEEVGSLTVIKSKKLTCFACGLYKDVQSPKMEPYGNFKKKVMVIGEAPGKEEDRNGKPWQGRVGRMLQCTLEELGIDLFDDCISLNAINCRPPDNRNPSPNELNCCREVKVIKAITDFNPEKIILLGGSALVSLLGHRWKKSLGGITKWRGWCIPDQEYKAWVCPTFHPSYVSRMDSKEVMMVWKGDLEKSFELGKLPEYSEPEIRCIDLEDMPEIDIGMAAFDYETTGLKPHAKGHRIRCASIAASSDIVYAFMIPSKKKEREPFLKFLRNKKIRKIASNMKFEDHWSNIRLGTEVKGWYWDTMLNAHILDNRPGICGLKFQAYIRLGVMGYDDEVGPYLKATNEETKEYGDNAINRIDELIAKPGGKEKLLKYCALDSLYEYRVAQAQIEEMEIRSLPF